MASVYPIASFIQPFINQIFKKVPENKLFGKQNSSLTRLFGYLRRMGCTGTPGMKAPGITSGLLAWFAQEQEVYNSKNCINTLMA